MEKQTVEVILKMIIKDVKGYMNYDEMKMLYDRAILATLPIVEIGAYQGRSTAVLGLASEMGNKAVVYSIDHHPEYSDGGVLFGPQDKRKLLRTILHFNLERIINVVNIPSYGLDVCRIFSDGIGLLYIDGKHDYKSVMRDYIKYGAIVKGDILFHDFTWDGPRKLIKEFGLKIVETAGNLARTEL